MHILSRHCYVNIKNTFRISAQLKGKSHLGLNLPSWPTWHLLDLRWAFPRPLGIPFAICQREKFYISANKTINSICHVFNDTF